MKNLLFIILLYPITSYSQTFNFDIKGSIVHNEDNKFAYLISDNYSDFFLKTVLINNKFEFKGETLQGDLLIKYGILFFDKRSDITAEEFKTKTENRIWEPGNDKNFKYLILEKVTLLADSSINIMNAKIIEGIYNMQTESFAISLKEESLIDCVKKYNDSNYTLSYLQGLIKFYQLPGANAENSFGDIAKMFDYLSVRLKQTQQGLKLKKQIDLLK